MAGDENNLPSSAGNIQHDDHRSQDESKAKSPFAAYICVPALAAIFVEYAIVNPIVDAAVGNHEDKATIKQNATYITTSTVFFITANGMRYYRNGTTFVGDALRLGGSCVSNIVEKGPACISGTLKAASDGASSLAQKGADCVGFVSGAFSRWCGGATEGETKSLLSDVELGNRKNYGANAH